MIRHFATAVDAGYLRRLKVLLSSMRRHCAPFQMHVLAWGADVVGWCASQPNVACTPMPLFHDRHPELLPAALPGPPRQRIDEYLCSVRWQFVHDLLITQGAPVLAVDADLMFWSSPEPVFDEIAAARVAVLPHDFPRAAEGLPGVTHEATRKFGLFNGGFAYFADPAPAAYMAEMTRQWCYRGFRTHANGRVTYGDQGYLELVYEQFDAHAIRNPAAAPGPWSIHRHRLERRAGGGLDFGGRPLVAYHYHSLQPLKQLAHRSYRINARQMLLLYIPYLAALAAAR